MNLTLQYAICWLLVAAAAGYLFSKFGLLQLVLPKRLVVKPDVRTSALVRKRRS